MTFKLINATEAKVGSVVVMGDEPCIVKSMDISKTGKHGHAKVRMEAVGIFDNKKRVTVIPGAERLEVPLIAKLKGQVLSIKEDKVSVMDLESFETFDIIVSQEIKQEIKEGNNVEYWDIGNKKIIKRRL